MIGGEESAGLSIAGHLPEKDGILACLLAAEMIAVRRRTLSEILKGIYTDAGTIYDTRVDVSINEDTKADLTKRLNDNPPFEFADIEVKSINSTDGKKFYLEDGSWVMYRISGTEPVVRCYVEASSKTKLKRLAEAAVKVTVGKSVPAGHIASREFLPVC
jgi:phosphomannomutase